MVVSKKCKICTALDADNIPISGEYFDKSLPVLIEKICGIELDPRKANGVLICKQCAIQLVHTDAVVDKLRNTLQRLTKILKVTKPKTPKSSTSQTKDNSDVKDVDAVQSITETGEVHSNTNSDESKTKSKKVVRRKSLFQEADLAVIEREPKDSVDTSINGNVDSSSVVKDVTKSKTPKKAVRRKSLFQTDNLITKDEEEKDNSETSNNGENIELKQTTDANITPQAITSKLTSVGQKKQVQPKQKTPKKTLPQNSVLPNDSVNTDGNEIQPAKFKKIADDEITPAKTTNTVKRKRVSNVNGVASSDKSLKSNVLETIPVKRNKTSSISAFEESPMDLTIDDRDLTETNESSFIKDLDKILNCVICGKGFSQKGSLREHIESSHMGEKLKQCSHCSTEFRSQQKYEAHVFSEKCKNTKHLCQYPNCNKRFKTVHKMELHMQEKHYSSKLESEDE